MKVSVYIATTLDGFIARENGELDWLPGSEGEVESGFENEDYGFSAFLESVDVLVMGRNTFEFVLSTGQWPYGKKRIIVLSSTLSKIPNEIPDTVELKSCSSRDLYLELKETGADHVYVDGGIAIQGFLKARLVDEIIITKIPVLIGKGISLFGPLEKDMKLIHIKTKSFKNGFIQSKYKVVR